MRRRKKQSQHTNKKKPRRDWGNYWFIRLLIVASAVMYYIEISDLLAEWRMRDEQIAWFHVARRGTSVPAWMVGQKIVGDANGGIYVVPRPDPDVGSWNAYIFIYKGKVVQIWRRFPKYLFRN